MHNVKPNRPEQSEETRRIVERVTMARQEREAAISVLFPWCIEELAGEYLLRLSDKQRALIGSASTRTLARNELQCRAISGIRKTNGGRGQTLIVESKS